MGDAPTRDFADLTIREMDRLQCWCDNLEKRIRKQEIRMAIIWWIGGAVVVVVGWAVAVIAS